MGIFASACVSPPRKQITVGLAARRDLLEDQLHHFLRRGFADQDEHGRGRVLLERFEGLQHHDAADFLFQVAAARADALGDADRRGGPAGC